MKKLSEWYSDHWELLAIMIIVVVCLVFGIGNDEQGHLQCSISINSKPSETK